MVACLLTMVLILDHSQAFAEAPQIAERPPEPKIAKGSVGSPQFDTSEGKVDAGTAFLVKTDAPSGVVVLTALHLFGPSGGLAAQKTQAELPKFVRGMTLADLKSGEVTTMTLKAFPVRNGAETEPDIAVFKPAGVPKSVNPGRFADNMPAIGETIWLAARVRYPKGVTFHPAVVTQINQSRIFCRFLDQAIETNGGSGGPYVNSKGEVIGIHNGSIKTPGDKQGVVLWNGAILELLRQMK